MICGVWAERGSAASLASAACCEPAGDISARFRRTTLRLALLPRGVPLLQLVLTGALGFDAYRRPGPLIAACCLALGWAGCLGARIWSTARPGWLVCCGDGAVSAAVLLMVGACVPDRLL